MNVTISYSEVRKKLKKSFDRVCENHELLLVTRKNSENVVIISEADYRALEETAYLTRSPKNLERLLQAMQREDGKSLAEVKNELGL